jgi:hypothetical protein
MLLLTIGAEEDDASDNLYGESGADWILQFLEDLVLKSDKVSPNIVSNLATP